jgi:streptogramin lyase
MMKIATFRSAALAAVLLGGATPAQAATITEYPLAKYAAPLGIAAGPDGNIWFAESGGNSIDRITPSGIVDRFPLADAQSFPQNVVPGPDGNVYFEAPGVQKAGFVKALGNLAVVELGSSYFAGAFGPRGQLWRVAVSDTVDWSDLGFLGSGVGCQMKDGFPHGFVSMTKGLHDYLWLTDDAGNAVVMLDTRYCQFSSIPLPNPSSGPKFITTGRDGAVWFTELSGDRIGRIEPYTLDLTEFALPPGSHPEMIVAAPDGTIWFAEHGTNKIGHMSRTGTLVELPVPTPASAPYGIAVGPDGSVWFTEEYGAKVGRIQLHPSGDVNADGLVNVADVVYPINFHFAGGPEPK